jgi:hypothetical protein
MLGLVLSSASGTEPGAVHRDMGCRMVGQACGKTLLADLVRFRTSSLHLLFASSVVCFTHQFRPYLRRPDMQQSRMARNQVLSRPSNSSRGFNMLFS